MRWLQYAEEWVHRQKNRIFLSSSQVPFEHKGGVYSTLSPRRGEVFAEDNVVGTPIYNLKAYLPVNESFGKFVAGFFHIVFVSGKSSTRPTPGGTTQKQEVQR